MINFIEAEQILNPFYQSFCNVFRNSIMEYKNNPQRVFFSQRTKSSAINDLILKNAQIEFANMDGIRFKRRYGTTYLIIRERLILKFKKFDRYLRTRNIPTKQSRGFSQQQVLGFSDNPPPTTNIFAGYQWDYVQNDILGLYITCPNGKKNEWFLTLPSAQITLAEVIPINPTPDPDSSKKKRVKPRRTGKNVNAKR